MIVFVFLNFQNLTVSYLRNLILINLLSKITENIYFIFSFESISFVLILIRYFTLNFALKDFLQERRIKIFFKFQHSYFTSPCGKITLLHRVPELFLFLYSLVKPRGLKSTNTSFKLHQWLFRRTKRIPNAREV